jgi:hypothetical protein
LLHIKKEEVEMKNHWSKLLIGFLFLVIALPAFGQSALSNFSVQGSAIGFTGAPGGTQAAVLAGAEYQLTTRVQLGYWNLSVPSLANYNFGEAGYGLPLSSLLGKTLSSKLTFDASSVGVIFQGGIGKVNQTIGTVSTDRVAEIVGATVSFPITASLTFNAVQAYWVHGGINGTSGFVVTPAVSSFPTVGMGINVSLDSAAADFKHKFVSHKESKRQMGRCLEC